MTTTRAWKPKSVYDACGAIESYDGAEHSQADIIAAFQYLIDDGTVWTLQGFYGRAAANLIASGRCKPPKGRD